jgi:CDP-diglyceride synthetase
MIESKRLKAYLAILAIIAFIALMYHLLYTKVPAENNDVMMILVGALIAIVKDLYGYYFGTSEGSQRKTELLGEKNAAANNPVV